MNLKILPNVITLIRIAVGLILMASLFYWHSITPLSLLTLILIGITDFIDGYVARKLNAESGWGRLLDPLADKIVIAGIFSFLFAIDLLDGWFLLAFLFREAVQIILRVLSFRRRIGNVIKTLYISKIKTGLCYLLCILLFIGKMYSDFMDLLRQIHGVLVIEVLILILAYMGWVYYYLSKSGSFKSDESFN